jgi:hypothetical protein
MMAYLVEMSARLVELHRVLTLTGSLYLHCDPTASRYLKLVLDAIFEPTRFRNEIVWKRSDAHNDATQGAKQYGRIHDLLLFYTKSDKYTFNTKWTALSQETADKWYRHVDKDGRRYNLADASAAKPGGDTLYEFHGTRPPKGRYWAYSKAKMYEMYAAGKLEFTKSGKVYMKRYLEDSKGLHFRTYGSTSTCCAELAPAKSASAIQLRSRCRFLNVSSRSRQTRAMSCLILSAVAVLR